VPALVAAAADILHGKVTIKHVVNVDLAPRAVGDAGLAEGDVSEIASLSFEGVLTLTHRLWLVAYLNACHSAVRAAGAPVVALRHVASLRAAAQMLLNTAPPQAQPSAAPESV